MGEKVFLGLSLIRFQGSTEDGLEIWRVFRRGCLRHRKSDTNELVDDGVGQKTSRQRGTTTSGSVFAAGASPGGGYKGHCLG